MKKQLFFRLHLQRKNLIKQALFDFFLGLASYPRLMLEVFIRRNFGQRYFSLATTITVGILLLLFPLASQKISGLIMRTSFGQFDQEDPGFWMHYSTWYLFLALFTYVSWLRWREIKRNTSVFEFGRYSLFSGEINSRFFLLSSQVRNLVSARLRFFSNLPSSF